MATTTMEEKILEMLKEAYPDLDSGVGTPFYELVVRPMAFLWSRHQDGITEIADANVLENYATMKEDDLDRIMTRYFATRKRGVQVFATVRIVFDTLRDYYVQTGVTVTASDNRPYTVVRDYYFAQNELPGNATDGYYIDVSVSSAGVGNTYNLNLGDVVEINDTALSPYIKKSYVLQDSSDGGLVETNAQFYSRVKNAMTLKNLTAYRATKGILTENFNVNEVVPIGLRDSEMRRDLTEVPGTGVIHRGGMADLYVRAEPYTILKGYKAPLGFPYAYAGKSVETDPNGLMMLWNAIDWASETDIYNRGSILEDIAGLSPQTNMFTLTSNIQPLHDFATHTEQEALHSNNLVKQMWPLVVRAKIRISDYRGSSILDTARSAAVKYIMGLSGSRAPKVSELAHALRNAGVQIVHLPMELECYYLAENLDMQKFGLNKTRVPATSLLKPVEEDGLKFILDDDTQMSIRTCVFYTNMNLINIEVV